MKSKTSQVLLVTALVVGSLLCWTAYGQEKKGPKVVWEYNVVLFNGDNMAQLNQLGAQGWEMVSVRTQEEQLGDFRQTKVYYYLKRAKQ